MELLPTLERFFQEKAPLAAGEGVVVAFSGGGDSTALLWGLSRLARHRGFSVHAAHLDHGLDPHSGERAAVAARLARDLSVPVLVGRRRIHEERLPGESLEAAGRRIRYDYLEEVRNQLGARYVATAHHRDDQVETVLLRLLYGTGVEGLAGIRPVRGRVVRPLLDLSRVELASAVAKAGFRPLDDPTNWDLRYPRNRLRHRILPHLLEEDSQWPQRLGRLARAAQGARGRLDEILGRHLRPRITAQTVAIRRRLLEELPEPLVGPALAFLARQAGAPYPPRIRVRREILRQLHRRGGVGCDGGDSWRWESRGEDLILRRREAPAPDFTYTLKVPGELEIPEAALRFRLTRGHVADWMFDGSPRRAGLVLPLEPGDTVRIRNRRPGDRLRPLGAPGTRRLKDLLNERRIPPLLRDRIPLLCLGDRIAWVPGVTIDESFRLEGHEKVWIAEMEAL